MPASAMAKPENHKLTQEVQPQAQAFIDQLPPEVLAHIFTLTLPPNPLAQRDPSEAPLLLERVSKFWREFSHSLPELWLSYVLQIEDTPQKRYSSAATPRHVAGLHEWLQKAGSLPLSLSLSLPTMMTRMMRATEPLVIVDAITPLVVAMHSYTHRCRSLSFQLGSANRGDMISYEGYPFDPASPGPFPFLEDINIELPGYRKFPTFLVSIVKAAPNLRRVSVIGFLPTLPSFIPGSAFEHLTYLRTDSRESPHTCCEVLRLAPNLRQCRFDTLVSDDDEDDTELIEPVLPITPIVHQLQKLYIGPTNFNRLFSAVTLPSLHSLSLNGRVDHIWDFFAMEDIIFRPIWEHHEFVSFLIRSSWPLTKLSFFEFQISSKTFIDCLEAVSQTLIELHVEGGSGGFVDEKVLDGLTYTSDESRSIAFLCPLLQRIRLRGYCLNGSMKGICMIEMLESRRQSIPVLGLSLLQWAYVGGNYEEKEWRRIEILEESGLELLVVEEAMDYLPHFLNDPELFECKHPYLIYRISIVKHYVL